MSAGEPETSLDKRFGDPDASATPWTEGRQRIEESEIFWISTVRPDGRPHVTPLISVWFDERAYFCTGADERKAKNLAGSPECILTTGCNQLDRGLDIVLEGEANRVEEEAKLSRVAAAYVAKYGEDWRFEVRDGLFHHEGGEALVFEVAPRTVFGFGKDPYSQTRWRFA